jgi:hypothetical protein
MSLFKTEDLDFTDGVTTIYELSLNYKAGSVSVKELTGSGDIPLLFNEIGENYIELVDLPTTGNTIRVTYTIDEPNKSASSLVERLVALEGIIEAQNKKITTLEKAVRNRVNVETFNVWIKLVEKKLGISVADRNLFSASNVYTGP